MFTEVDFAGNTIIYTYIVQRRDLYRKDKDFFFIASNTGTRDAMNNIIRTFRPSRYTVPYMLGKGGRETRAVVFFHALNDQNDSVALVYVVHVLELLR